MYMVIVDYIDADGKPKYFYSKEVKSIVYKEGIAYIHHDKGDKLIWQLDQFSNVKDLYVIDRQHNSELEVIIK